MAKKGSSPIELVKDGDLLLLVDRIWCMSGRGTVRITKVKGHADEVMVLNGGVRDLDRIGTNAADEAADFGRRRVDFPVVDARRDLARACGQWYPVVQDLHRSFHCYPMTGNSSRPFSLFCWCFAKKTKVGASRS